MELDDIPAVAQVERQSFSTPWPVQAYRRELKENRLARYVVARRTGPPLAAEVPLPPADQPVSPEATMGWRGLFRRFTGIGGALEAPRSTRAQRVVGYAGLWLMVDEAHITAIAVAPAYRGLGVGELILQRLFDISLDIGAQYMTLEVRVSNSLAQTLYRKYTFKETGVRKRYYSDNNEDALIMWSDPIDSPSFRAMLQDRREALDARLRSPRTRAELSARLAHG